MATWYVDNTLVYTGTVTTDVGVNAFWDTSLLTAFPGLVNQDSRLMYYGIVFHGRTSSGAWQITNVLPGTPSIVFSPSTAAVTVGDTYTIYAGTNRNSTMSQNPTTLLTGPKLTVQDAVAAAADGDTIYVKYTGRTYIASNYDGTEGAVSNRGVIYTNNNRQLTIEGFYQTPGDLSLSDPTSIYDINSRLLTSAAEQLDTSYFPTISNTEVAIDGVTDSSIYPTVYIDTGSSSQTSSPKLNIKCLKIDRLVDTNSVAHNIITTAGSEGGITLDRCVIGNSSYYATSMNGFFDNTSSGTNKNLVIKKCIMYVTGNFTFVNNCNLFQATDNYFICRATSDYGSFEGVFGEITVTPNAESSTDHVLQIKIKGNKLYTYSPDTSNSSHGATPIRIYDNTSFDLMSDFSAPSAGATFCKHIEITHNYIWQDTSSYTIYIASAPSFDISYNTLINISAVIPATSIRLGAGANVTRWTPGSQTRILRRNRVASGTATSVTLDSAATTTADTYKYMGIRVYSMASALTYLSPVISRTNSIPSSPTSGDRYLVKPTASGAWAPAGVPKDDNIAEWNGLSWDFTAPADNNAVVVRASNSIWVYASSWTYASSSWHFTENLVQTRRISAYSTGRVCTTTGYNMSPLPAAGDIYEIFEETINQLRVCNNYIEFTSAAANSGRGIQIGIDVTGVLCSGNSIKNADVGIWVHGHKNTIENNCTYGYSGIELFGGSYNKVRNNTFVTANRDNSNLVSPIVLKDRSNHDATVSSSSYIWQAQTINAKPMGNEFTNNICVLTNAGLKTYIVYENLENDAKFGSQPTLRPLAQWNYFDYNCYWRYDTNEDISGISANAPLIYIDGTDVLTLSALQTKWSTYSTAFPLNDAHSIYANPMLYSPSTGDFRLRQGSPCLDAGNIPGVNMGGSAVSALRASFSTTAGSANGRSILITLTAGGDDDATETQWHFVITNGETFDIITRPSGTASANVLDSGVDFIDIWLPPLSEFQLRIRQRHGGAWGNWSSYSTLTTGPT